MSNFDMWEVFIQTKPGLAHKHAGTVQAATAETALQNARDVYTRRMEGTSIWVVPSKYIATSEGMDKEAFFDPADDKLYRHPTFYNIPSDVKNM
ncbi:MAG: 1,2-phenylacetyl-CoA epoxidase subunit B [Flavobacteriaceae bacterium]|jgi:ring-1,2-phenylacetyl-CoA epoxidase subunit PaaB|nr:1,2-phenylacetyl-CoA epoxidase subunit B [Flavobacteriaceae bacterium]